MGLFERGGRWYYRFKIDGKAYRGSTGLKATERNRSSAQLQESRRRQAILEGRDEPRIRVRLFSDAAEAFLAWAEKEHGDHPNTGRRLRTSFASLTEFFATRPIISLTEGSIEDYKTWRRENGIKEVTIRHDLHALSKFYRYAINQRWARRNPVENVEMPSDADALRMHVLTAEEERLYFARARGVLYDLGRLMLNQGCRPEELMRLRKEDVDLDRREMHIRQGKSKAARRTLHLTNESLSILARRLSEKGENVPKKKRKAALEALKQPSPWMFPSRKRRSRHVTKLNSAHDRLLWILNHEQVEVIENGQKKLVWREKPGPQVKFVLYDLRHTFATRFAEKVPNLELLMRILGHSSLRVIMRYVHPTQAAQKAAMEIFDTAQMERLNVELPSQRKM